MLHTPAALLAPLFPLWLACAVFFAPSAATAGAPADSTSAVPAAPATPAAPAPARAGEREGRGEREIVLIHSVGSSAAVWDEVVPLLSRSHRVWTYELPGHGRTKPLPKLTITTAAEDLGRFLQDNDIAYPVLVGHAMGGLIAMRYTFDHPADVRRLIVIDAAPRQLASEEQKSWTVEELLHDYDRFVAAMYANMSPLPEVTNRIVDQALKTDRASFTSLVMSGFRFDLTQELPRQAVPILVIGSALLFPSDEGARARLDELGFGTARTVSFKRIGSAGHFVMLEEPSYLASVILAWSVSH